MNAKLLKETKTQKLNDLTMATQLVSGSAKTGTQMVRDTRSYFSELCINGSKQI